MNVIGRFTVNEMIQIYDFACCFIIRIVYSIVYTLFEIFSKLMANFKSYVNKCLTPKMVIRLFMLIHL